MVGQESSFNKLSAPERIPPVAVPNPSPTYKQACCQPRRLNYVSQPQSHTMIGAGVLKGRHLLSQRPYWN